ncbi:hypothetical protein R4Z09_10310 [Niallia oryzisoli]|uniref:Uncharacterized protein n=1 Tax=Niallia oryzisoli TaxID=1737571 RepID=A0ABZ2CLB6_9BACI
MRRNSSASRSRNNYGFNSSGLYPNQYHGHSGTGNVQNEQVKAKIVNSDYYPVAPWRGAVKLDYPFVDAIVQLADFELEIDVEADIELPTPAKEIKSVRKNVSLKQCKAVPSSHSPDVVKLFITGILHKNIQYVESGSGFVRDFAVDVKFSTIKRVELDNPVMNPFGQEDFEFSQKTSTHEYRESNKSGHGANPHVSGFESFETFNEPIECKLLGTKIRELDLFNDFDHGGRFNHITEKAELRLFIRLTQMQKVMLEDSDNDYSKYHKNYMKNDNNNKKDGYESKNYKNEDYNKNDDDDDDRYGNN